MDSIEIAIGLGTLPALFLFIIVIILLVFLGKVSKMTADIRAIRQSIPMAYKYEMWDRSLKEAKLAIKMGEKAYARIILLRTKEELAERAAVAVDTHVYDEPIAEIDQLLSELPS
jgi:predicted Holliday junction resolvase-like endonuclease